MILPILLVAAAHADTECMDVGAFNSYMQSHDPSPSVTLRFDVTGVNPNDFFGTKGCLADLTDTTCAEGGALNLKVYGVDDPPNTSHPAGTLKHEYGYNCGPNPGVEYWAEPNASETIFVDGSERCDVTIWIDPDTFGYRLECEHGTWEGMASNDAEMPVNWITMFALTDPDTWHIDNAVSTWNEVCFESGIEGGEDTGTDPEEEEEETEGGVVTVGAMEDVTVSMTWPDSVFPDPGDLAVDGLDSEVYLKFDLSGVPGRITAATLHLTSLTDASAEGSGAVAWEVHDTSWSESTLTWNARPGSQGQALDRVAPVSPGQDYDLDVSAALSEPGVIALALLPGTGDDNGVHFFSKESSADMGPRLEVTWEDDGTTGEGEDGDVSDSGVGGNAEEDEQALSDEGAPTMASTGCGCGTGRAPAWPGALALGGAATLARRRRVPAASPRSASPAPAA